jgi:thiamine-monophosphate kinase
VELGCWLAEQKLATAMMDVSDGLSSDLPRLCAASGVGVLVDPGKLPTPHGIAQEAATQLALHGGDDYELLFTISPRKAAFPSQFGKLRLTRIGEITTGRGVRIIGKEGNPEPLHAAGWDPFRKKR